MEYIGVPSFPDRVIWASMKYPGPGLQSLRNTEIIKLLLYRHLCEDVVTFYWILIRLSKHQLLLMEKLMGQHR